MQAQQTITEHNRLKIAHSKYKRNTLHFGQTKQHGNHIIPIKAVFIENRKTFLFLFDYRS